MTKGECELCHELIQPGEDCFESTLYGPVHWECFNDD